MVNQVLVGSGVVVKNVIFKGDTNAIGIFDGRNSNIGLDSGIIITTGLARNAIGPNNDKASTSNQKVGDGDLNSLLSGASTNDAASLQFEFIPVSSIVKFRFVFASEEYPQWVGFPYNDIFGFFLSGPGIVGKKNIALIPNTNTPISINTINDSTNSNLYFDNQNGVTVQYDGFTKVIEIVADNLTPCQTYVIKMAIADVDDYAYDSGFFLEALSLKSEAENEAKVDLYVPLGKNIIQEKCDSSVFRFTRSSSNTSTNLKVKYNITGAATMGVDYLPIPDSIVIQTGKMFADLVVFPIDDNVVEPTEGVILTITSNGICSKSFDSVAIKDFDTLTIVGIKKIFCTGDTISKIVKYSGGSSHLSYTWTDSLGVIKSLSAVIDASPDSLTMYIISIYDSCINYTSKDTFYIPPIIPVTLVSSSDTIVCAPTDIFFSVKSNVPGLHYQWGATTIDFTAVGLIENDTLMTTKYSVPSGVSPIIVTCVVTDENYCANEIQYKISSIPKGVYGPKTVYVCKGDSISIKAYGGGEYTWSPSTGIVGDTTLASVRIFKPGSYIAKIKDTVDCIKEVSIEVVYDTIPVANAGEDVVICERSSVPLSAGGSDYDTYEWSPSASLSNSKIANPLAGPSKTTTYYLKAINHACFSYDSVVVHVIVRPELIVDYSFDSCAKTVYFSNTTVATDSFYWDFGDSKHSLERNPIHRYDTTGAMTVTLIANRGTDCTDTSTFTLNLLDVDPKQRKVPNVFTPNGDNINDIFRITGGNVNCAIEKMSIYNRWGKLMHEIKDAETWEWDGRIGGEIVPPGVYFYSIIGKGFEDVGMVNVIY
jgi:gliding motility-associated-like protein